MLMVLPFNVINWLEGTKSSFLITSYITGSRLGSAEIFGFIQQPWPLDLVCANV